MTNVPDLHLVPAYETSPGPSPVRDLSRATQAAADLLTALGVALDSPDLRRTPHRMAHALAELLTPEPFEPTTFDTETTADLVLVRAIPFASLCEHHCLPFTGTADVAYVPGAKLAGLSKLAWAVRMHAGRLQVQERLTSEIADWLEANLDPRGVAVRLRAEHMCMSLRGVKALGAVTVTSTARGVFVEDPQLRAEWISSTSGSDGF